VAFGLLRVLTMRIAFLAATLAGCAFSPGMGGGDDDPPDASGPDDVPDAAPVDVPDRGCATRFSYRPDGAVEAVEIAGEWDWELREPMTDPDGDGEYALDKVLAAGVWAYKLVVTRPGGGVEWLFDPANPYRAYDDGVENSGARVDDCSRPLVELVSHQVDGDGATTAVRLWRGAGGAAITTAGVRASVRFEAGSTPAEVAVDGATASVTLDALPPGKHTLVIELEDQAGIAAEPLRLPFWIEPARFDWRDALIYMVMTDRFANGDPDNDPAPAPDADPGAAFFGGDLRGLTAAIEDGTIDGLGVRALWLSPFVENSTTVHFEDGHGVTAFHGYWPVRARAVDPRLGTEADLDALVTAAHRRGIRVLMDYVINHVHEDHEYVAAHPDWFRTGCECGEPGCDWTEHRLDCSFHPYMPDVDWQHREASEQMIADALWWLDRFDLDGLRVDAVKHVEDLAVANLSTRIHDAFEQGGTEYFLLGETAMGWAGDDLDDNLPEYQTIARYIGEYGLSGQFDFVLYHATAYRVWADDWRGMLHLDFWTRASLEQYPADAVMTPFVGSHDSERLISLADYGSGDPIVHHKWADQGLPAPPSTDEPYHRAAIALTWMLTVPGAPLLYYGDEYGEHGGADPDNRHMWTPPAERSPREQALHARVARAGQLRRELAPLRRGDYRSLTVTEDLLSFARVWEGEAVIVAINRAGVQRTVEIDVSGLLPDGTVTDHLGERTLEVSGGMMSVTLDGRTAAIVAP
jgi:glycosidase